MTDVPAPDSGSMQASRDAETLLRLEAVSVAVEGRRLLEGVSFSLAEGGAMAVVGPNGAGKTTLLRCVLDMMPGRTGTVSLWGRPVDRMRPRERARLVSYVPQLDGRALPFRVREFVEMGRYPHQEPLAGPTAADREAVERALRLTGLASLGHRRLATLSGGERQQAFIAAALAQGGSLLLLDEPTAFLDYAHQVRVHEILAAVRTETNTAILLVTHDVNEALAVADQAVALGEGRVVAQGGVGILTDPEVLTRIYGVPFSGVSSACRRWPWMFPGGASGGESRQESGGELRQESGGESRQESGGDSGGDA